MQSNSIVVVYISIYRTLKTACFCFQMFLIEQECWNLTNTHFETLLSCLVSSLFQRRHFQTILCSEQRFNASEKYIWAALPASFLPLQHTGTGLRAQDSSGNINPGSPCQPQFMFWVHCGCEQGRRCRVQRHSHSAAKDNSLLPGTLPLQSLPALGGWLCFSTPPNEAMEEDPGDSDGVGWMSVSWTLSN